MQNRTGKQSIVLCGNPYNPLSAVAANSIHARGELAAIIIPRQVTVKNRFNQGFRQAVSLYIIAFYRLMHIILRDIGLKKSKDYCSLKEFIKGNPDIPVICVEEDISDLHSKIAEILPNNEKEKIRLLVSCVFPYLLPINIEGIHYAINIHPGILPDNRGSDPYFWALAKKMPKTGITFHKLSHKFDSGPILKTVYFEIGTGWSEYHIERKTCDMLRATMDELLNSIPALWASAIKQKEGVYYKKPSLRLRKKYGIFSKIHISDVLGRY